MIKKRFCTWKDCKLCKARGRDDLENPQDWVYCMLHDGTGFHYDQSLWKQCPLCAAQNPVPKVAPDCAMLCTGPDVGPACGALPGGTACCC